jgi:hypothetical protein
LYPLWNYNYHINVMCQKKKDNHWWNSTQFVNSCDINNTNDLYVNPKTAIYRIEYIKSLYTHFYFKKIEFSYYIFKINTSCFPETTGYSLMKYLANFAFYIMLISTNLWNSCFNIDCQYLKKNHGWQYRVKVLVQAVFKKLLYIS